MSLSNSAGDISNSLSSYSSALSNAWQGKAGEHLKSLCTDQIMPKLDSLKTKGANYEAAVAIAGEIDLHMSNIQSLQAQRSGIDRKDKKQLGMLSRIDSMIESEQQQITKLKQQVKGLLG